MAIFYSGQLKSEQEYILAQAQKHIEIQVEIHVFLATSFSLYLFTILSCSSLYFGGWLIGVLDLRKWLWELEWWILLVEELSPLWLRKFQPKFCAWLRYFRLLCFPRSLNLSEKSIRCWILLKESYLGFI